MSTLNATLALYRTAAQDTWASLRRSALAMAFLLGAFAAFIGLAIAMSPFGMAGGFVLGFVRAGLIGWYLALLEIAVVGRRRVRVDDVKETLGTYFWETISILFLFFVPELILSMSAPQALLVLVPIASLVFNPAPEMLYQERTQSTQTLGDAARFMQQNWPEWLGAHLLAGVVLIGWGWALTGALHASWLLKVVQLFGPWFEFIMGGALALQLGGSGAAGVLSFFGMFVFVHAFMLFRGHLYRKLRSTSRRARAWQARL